MFCNRKKNRQDSYFISIGAGINQLPLIAEAKKTGLRIIAVDNNIQSPGFIISDLRIQESIYSYNEIYKKISGVLNGRVKGILTRSYGKAVKTTAYLNEKFNIPYLPFKRSDDFINKPAMKNIFRANSIKTPRTIRFNAETARKHNIKNTPLIAKPVTGHAKSGVKTIRSIKELRAEVKKSEYSSGKIIIEEMITGDEIIASGIVVNGIYHLIEITDKITGPYPDFFDRIHSSPSKYHEYAEKIRETGQKVAEAFSITTSPLIMEIIITSNNQMFLIEAVPEFGGEYLADLLIPVKTGYNFFKEAVRAVCGMKFKKPPKIKTRSAFVIRFVSGDRGRLISCDTSAPSKIAGIVAVKLLKEPGSELRKPLSNHDRIAVIASKGSSINKALETAEQAEEAMKIRIEK